MVEPWHKGGGLDEGSACQSCLGGADDGGHGTSSEVIQGAINERPKKPCQECIPGLTIGFTDEQFKTMKSV